MLNIEILLFVENRGNPLVKDNHYYTRHHKERSIHCPRANFCM